jgi:O-antigen ligase
MKKPKLNFTSLIEGLFFAYLVLFPFGVLTQIPLPIWGLPEIRLYLTDIILALLLLSWGIWRFFFNKKKYQLPPLALPIFSFAIIALLSLGLATPLLPNREVAISSLYLIRWLAYASLYFVIFDTKKAIFRNIKPLNIFIILGTTITLFGFIQYLLFPNLKPLEALHWDPHFYRLVSTFLDPGFTGLILVLTLIVLINVLFEKKKNPWLILSGALTYVALILTHSRSSYLAFFIAMGIIAFLRKNLKFFLIASLVLGLSLTILPQPQGEGGKLTRTYTILDRFQSWQNATTIIKDHPILGVGFNTYRYIQRDYGFLEEENWQESHGASGTDSSLLFILATTGILGLASYLWFLISAGALAFRQKKKAIGIIAIASLGAILIHSFFLNSLFYPWVVGWLMILLVCLEKQE